MKKSPVALMIVIDAMGLSTLEFLLGKTQRNVNLPNLSKMGLGNIVLPEFRNRFGEADGKSFAKRIQQVSATADSLIGHREMMGVVDHRTYNLFPNGFDPKFLAELEKRTGHKSFFNKMAGGVEAIEMNYKHHEETGELIAYASKCDPLVQFAMSEKVIPVPEQYRIVETAFALAREMGIPITRAIARPYIRTEAGEIVRTSNRHDAVLPIGQTTLVDILRDDCVWTIAVGKTSDLVNTAYHSKIKLNKEIYLDPEMDLHFAHPKRKDTNPFCIQGTINALRESHNVYRPKGTFIFTNLVDTDSVYGHTRDVDGSLRSLEEIDRCLPKIQAEMEDGDLLIITADHGMEHRADYGYHSNEPVPFIAQVKGGDATLGGLKTGLKLGLTDMGNVIAQYFHEEEKYAAIIRK